MDYKFIFTLLAGLLFSISLAGCGANEVVQEPPELAKEAENASNVSQDEESAAAPAINESSKPLRIENGDGPPFYARFGKNELFSDGERVVIIFYRSPDCIPADFNMNQFFHFPSENGPGAFGCAPPTTSSIDTWANSPETDPAPLVAEITGLGAVPVWFIEVSEVEEALADGFVTIGELAELPSRIEGTASSYTELLHPTQSNESPLIQFTGSGTTEDGGNFSVDVSQGATDVEDHIIIDLS